MRAFLKTSLKHIASKLGVEIKRRSSGQGQIVSLQPQSPKIGNVLLSHSLLPFLLNGSPVPHNHDGHWRGLEIAKTFVDLRYAVDVIDYHNESFLPEKDYSIFIDSYINLERIAPLLHRDCVKIMHIQTAHWVFQNSAEYGRNLALQQRRGVCLPLKRQLRPHWAIEHADHGIIQGNVFTCHTYGYANKPLYRVPTPGAFRYPWPEDKNWEKSRRRFLWFGNHGFVHKGLDLVLEAFSEMPAYHLTVCGPLDRETEFERAYFRELYQTPNIETVGWIDINSKEFTEITNNTIGLVYPSCSEGQCGAVITCLHAGLIPLVSYESGVDVNDFGCIMRECSIENIKRSVQMTADLPIRELRDRARQAWEFARVNYTREKFTEEYRKAVTAILTTRPGLQSASHSYGSERLTTDRQSA